MPIRLRAGLSWCICARQTVFLDLPRDRYFCLPEPLDTLFRRWAAGEAIASADETRLFACGVAEAGDAEPRDARPKAAAKPPPAMRDHAIDSARSASMADIVPAITGQLRARRWLRRVPLATIVARIAAQRPATSFRAPDEARQRRIAGAFATSTMLLRAADQCLPRAIAAQWLCRRHGQDTALIFGVRVDPFAAHSWVQAGDAVIVGDLEQVRLYTPILVVR